MTNPAQTTWQFFLGVWHSPLFLTLALFHSPVLVITLSHLFFHLARKSISPWRAQIHIPKEIKQTEKYYKRWEFYHTICQTLLNLNIKNAYSKRKYSLKFLRKKETKPRGQSGEHAHTDTHWNKKVKQNERYPLNLICWAIQSLSSQHEVVRLTKGEKKTSDNK